jgi:hypothetical protein
MIRRYLSRQSVDALKASQLWKNLCADSELQPEIRDDAVTVYYRGGALLRNLKVKGDFLHAEVHPKFVPFSGTETNTYLQLSGTSTGGIAFVEPPAPLSLGVATQDILDAYKAMMDQVLVAFPEGQIIQAICCRPENQILDQEITFQESGESRDKIDLCHFDDVLGKLVFVEVKRVNDERLFQQKAGSRPEVLDQLQSYGCRLQTQRDTILTAYRQVVSLKRELGLGERLKKMPTDGPRELLERPVLVIGNCSRTDVRQILNSKEDWQPLLAGLKDVAAGLILCGQDGCRLSLTNGRQTRVF